MTGFQLINGTWQIQCAMLMGSVYMILVYPITCENDCDWVRAVAVARWSSIISHLISAVVLIIYSGSSTNYATIKMLVNMVAMISTLMMNIEVGWALYIMPRKNVDGADLSTFASEIWFSCEIWIFAAIILSYTFFLLFRSCTKHKIYPEDFVHLAQKSPDTESVIALEKIIKPFVNSFCPLLVGIVIL